MKSTSLTVLAGAMAVALAGCGGGGTSADEGNAAASVLELSGTAATGLALATSPVSAKCATGTATGETLVDGTYTLSIENGALPCVLQVTGTADGVEIVLHSVIEAGTADGGTTGAVANITPLTEMVVAQLTGALPSELFEGFDSNAAAQITPTALNTATTEVVTALKDATGIDLGTIDPFKAPLVAATSSAPTAGNQYDQLLDALKIQVPTESLSLVVNQIASAANNTDTSENAPPTLTQVMSSVGEHLAHCPAAVSGKYRGIDYFGRTRVYQLDFKNSKVKSGTGEDLFTIEAIDAANPCEFEATGTDVLFKMAFGQAGVGAYSVTNTATNRSVTGYIFPMQKHTLATVAGTWDFAQSGYMADELPGMQFRHWLGQITFGTNGNVNFCDRDPDQAWACIPEDDQELIVEGPDHGFRISDPNDETNGQAPVYAYRAPNGSLTLFGTTNPAGDNTSTEQTSFVAYKGQALTLPAVGTVNKYWDFTLIRSGPNNLVSMARDSNTITSVDTVAQTVTRTRASDDRVDTYKINHPFTGVRHRAQTDTLSGVVAISLPGLGMGTALSDGSGGHFHVISINRP